jgi:6,7-dimethyl-8-ribityllumazine synthase
MARAQEMRQPTARLAPGVKLACVVSRYHEEITGAMRDSAVETLRAAGLEEADLVEARVPGAFELPLVAQRLAESGRFDAVICLGCLIKGDTMHFEYIASAVSQGIMDAGTSTGVPVTFGVLTTLTDEQAVLRSADGPENKGREAALAAVDMATLCRHIGKAGLHS